MEPLSLYEQASVSYSQPSKETDLKTISKEQPTVRKHKPIHKMKKALHQEVSTSSI